MDTESHLFEEYFAIVEATGAQRSLPNYKFYLSYLYREVSFAGKSVLDIGGGSGYMGFYAACRGAKEVVCLEPEESGANAQLNEAFSQFQSRLPASRTTATVGRAGLLLTVRHCGARRFRKRSFEVCLPDLQRNLHESRSGPLS
jgi:16S rRNA G966 N2-methylase RsmD